MRPMQQSNPDLGHRRTTAYLRVIGSDGSPLTHQEMTVAQKNHKLLFGCNGYDLIPWVNDALSGAKKEAAEQYAKKFRTLFNYATLPFYWGRFEPQPGRTNTSKLKNTAKWCVQHQLAVKGHPLCWHTLAPDWLLSLNNEEILQKQLARIGREVAGFKGLIDTWDVINEAVIMPIFNKYDNGMTRICQELGRIPTIRHMFAAARAANPGSTLLINDFDTSPAFDILVEGCLEAGIEIDAIGIQSHMHQGYWGVEKTLRILERFERFGLPIHFTEITILSGRLMPPGYEDLNDYRTDDWPTTPEGENRQAEEVLLHYKTLVSHPLVAAITWWDFADGKWLNAPGGLIRNDGSSKPAYDELVKLIKGEWWLKPALFSTDHAGRVQICGFPGEYELNCRDRKIAFTLNGAGAAEIEIRV
jgi:endo-1,4-beta-xylanase